MDHTVDTTDLVRASSPSDGREKARDRGGLAVVSLIWVAAAFVGGLFVVDAIGALETDPDDCSAYTYGSGPGGYGCDPTASDAAITVSATEDLADRQLVTVAGTRYDAWTQIGVVQCAGEAFLDPDTPSSAQACDLSTVRIVYSNGAGDFSTSVRLRRVITTAEGGEVDCAMADSYCIVAAGAVGSDLMSTTEADYAFIAFDPDLPPVPPPTVAVEVIDIDATRAVVAVTCTNLTNLSVDVSLQQERRGLFGSAYGYIYAQPDEAICSAESTEYEVELASYDRRIGRGDVTYYVSAYGDDGFEGVSSFVSGEFRQRSTPRVEYRTENLPSETVEILDAEIVGRGEDQRVRVRLECERAGQYGDVRVMIGQWAGLDLITARGAASFTGCPGEIDVDVPFAPFNGRLQTGNAQLDVRVTLQGNTELGGGFFYERATSADRIRLRGRLAAPLEQLEVNPDSRITIERVTRDGISGTVECDEPVLVDVQAQSRQYQGRIIRGSYAYDEGSFGQVECDGEVDFDLEWNTRLSRGDVNVTVYASGYEYFDTPDLPTTSTTVPPTTTLPAGAPVVPVVFADDVGAGSEANGLPSREGAAADGGYYRYVWDDYQTETLRVRR